MRLLIAIYIYIFINHLDKVYMRTKECTSHKGVRNIHLVKFLYQRPLTAA